MDADKYWDLAIDGFGLQSEWLDQTLSLDIVVSCWHEGTSDHSINTGVMLNGMVVVLTRFTSGTMGLLSGFNCVTIRVTVTFLSPSMAVKTKCHSFCIW